MLFSLLSVKLNSWLAHSNSVNPPGACAPNYLHNRNVQTLMTKFHPLSMRACSILSWALPQATCWCCRFSNTHPSIHPYIHSSIHPSKFTVGDVVYNLHRLKHPTGSKIYSLSLVCISVKVDPCHWNLFRYLSARKKERDKDVFLLLWLNCGIMIESKNVSIIFDLQKNALQIYICVPCIIAYLFVILFYFFCRQECCVLKIVWITQLNIETPSSRLFWSILCFLVTLREL